MTPVDRRDFLGTFAAAGAALVAMKSAAEAAPSPGEKPRVVRCRRDNAVTEADAVNAAAVREMVDLSVAKLVGAPTAEAAWRSLFTPQDVVTIKINGLFGPGACSHFEVTDAVVRGLLAAGVPANNITVWDRSDGDLAKSGYELNKGEGVKVCGTGWEAQATTSGSMKGRLATVLTRAENTALVNVPVLKSHGASGITLALKNHYGSLDNPGAHHGNNCDPYLPDLCALPVIRDKTRLIVADALRPVGEGGPAASPQHTWTYGAILAATDSVAVDAVGCRILDEWRAAKGMPPLEPRAHFLRTAAEKGLGVCDLAKIELLDC